jgi:hypothetical protein
MTPIEALASPVVDAREVVESYRWGRVEVPDWPALLRAAADALRALERDGVTTVSGVRLEVVSTGLAGLARNGLVDDPVLLTDLSRQLETLVQRTRPSGFPAPGDADVSF